jgi:hypothetical protein
MNETSQDHEFEPQTRLGWRQMIGTGAWLLVIATAAVATLVLPKLADPLGVLLAGLGMLAAGAKR